MNDTQSIYGLVGYKLSHSFSRTFFNEKFQKEGISAEYRNFELNTIDELKNILESTPQLHGLNVTIPYKECIIPLLDEIDETVRLIGAVNVVKIRRDSNGMKLKGYNSDIIGFTNSIKPLLSSAHRKALILGTGGASKAVWHGLKALGIEPLLVSRNRKNDIVCYDDLNREIISTHTVIINATPLGMYPNVEQCPPIPYTYLTSDHIAYDLTYNPETTKFMKECGKYGAVTKNGLEMLHGQAIAAWEIWNK